MYMIYNSEAIQLLLRSTPAFPCSLTLSVRLVVVAGPGFEKKGGGVGRHVWDIFKITAFAFC